MFSFTHLLLMGAIALLIFGPSRIPRLGRTLGDGVREFKRGLRGDTNEADEIDVTPPARCPPDVEI